MEMKKSELKVKLSDLKISSFVTSLDSAEIKGGDSIAHSMGHTLCNNMDCTVVAICGGGGGMQEYR